MSKTTKNIASAIKDASKAKTKGYDTSATVKRVEGDTIWVHIPGGVDETPVRRTIDAKAGDTVQVRVAGGKAWLTGNATRPPTDDAVAIVAKESADYAVGEATRAHEAADEAWTYAESAHEAATVAWGHAEEAHQQAERATGYANDSLSQLGIVEDVVGTLNWITTHATYKLTEDEEVRAGKWYFTKSGDTYNVVVNPTGDPSAQGWYEIDSIDEAVSNYVSSHLALTDAGLWVTKDNQGYKILLANDGMKVYDSAGHLVSTFGESITFDSERPQTIGNNSTYIKWYDSNNDGKADSLEIAGSNVSIASNVTIGGMPTKVSDLTNDSGFQTASDVSTAVSNGVSGKADKTDAVGRTQRIYYRKTTSGAPSKNTTWLSTSGTGYGNWSLKIPQLTSGTTKYPYLYTAVQTQTVSQMSGTTCSCSDVLLDDTTTIIDGGTIITGTVNANVMNASLGKFDAALIPNLQASSIYVGADVLTNVLNDVTDELGNIYQLNILTNYTSTSVVHTAQLLQNGVDVSAQTPNDFEWNAKLTSGYQFIGNGRSITIQQSSLHYAHAVTVSWTRRQYAYLLNNSGNNLVTNTGNKLIGRTEY